MTIHLVDTSAWVEWFRDTDSPAARAVAELRGDPAGIAVTQPVALEVRAGTRRVNLPAVNRILDNAVQLSVEPNIDFNSAGDLYLAARDAGKPVRSLMDCVTAAVAIRTGAVLVHHDRDFDVLATIAKDLRVWPAR
ncbi:MAG TPA: PIN domain-containing protein [Actinophytocola sp.]|uniref:type II toxin-antitoxin system VapC family toxin n=1 Tax=Actinophytocola sp. TaxID=1872138 RepID=UPI002DDCABB7|nr:PIN domain-containing protein [Actinophytocola sp.]HEV2784577.1 PIN domain-containing protein [Actinophytocola sp.]